jgi:hypothetical protein
MRPSNLVAALFERNPRLPWGNPIALVMPRSPLVAGVSSVGQPTRRVPRLLIAPLTLIKRRLRALASLASSPPALASGVLDMCWYVHSHRTLLRWSRRQQGRRTHPANRAAAKARTVLEMPQLGGWTPRSYGSMFDTTGWLMRDHPWVGKRAQHARRISHDYVGGGGR